MLRVIRILLARRCKTVEGWVLRFGVVRKRNRRVRAEDVEMASLSKRATSASGGLVTTTGQAGDDKCCV